MQIETQIINNRYKLQERLGKGGMGAVYRANDRLTGAEIALKMVSRTTMPTIPTAQASADELHIALANEFRSLASLRHPNIIPVLDYGFYDGMPFFTMQYIADAKSITEFGITASPARKADLLLAMLEALAYLHRRGIIHRDLKPENALVGADDRFCLLDFGLAEENPQASHDGRVTGTLAYIAPEVLQGASPTEAADLYAVGLIAYQLYTGAYPFIYDRVSDLVEHVVKSEPQYEGLDVEPEMVAIMRKLLHKNPKERYQQAGDVITDLLRASKIQRNYQQDGRESYLQAARFVGRQQELTQLETALEQALNGKGSSWLIGGESGVGKTRLIDEIRIRAMVRGALVLVSQAVDGGSLPYQIWREPIRHLLLTCTISDTDASILKLLVPDIEKLLERPIGDAPIVDGDAAQKRLLGAILSLFRVCKHPIVLLLEDIQWMSDTLELVQGLVSNTPDLPVLVLATYRSDERPNLPQELKDMQHRLLNRLTLDEIQRLSESMLGAYGRDSHVVDLLAKETEGNVFFLVETVRVLAEEAGSLDNIGRMTLPPTVFAGGIQRVVERRLSRIPEAYRPLLSAAAIAGRMVDPAILRPLAGDIVFEDWLNSCINGAILTVQEGRFQFAHDKIREGVIASLNPQQVTALHRAVAIAIESAYPDQESQALRLAIHWRHAGDNEKEAHYSYLAGLQERYSQPNEAQKHLFRTLELIAETDSRYGNCNRILGDLAIHTSDFAIAEKYYIRSLSFGIEREDHELVAQTLDGLGTITMRASRYDDARSCYIEALGFAKRTQDSKLIAHALCSIGAVDLDEGNYQVAQAHFEEALKLINNAQDHAVKTRIINNLGVIAYRTGKIQEASDHFEQVLALRRSAGMRHGISASLNNLGVIAVARGDYQRAFSYHQESLAIKRELGDRYGMSNSLANLGLVETRLNQYENAQKHFEDSLQISEAIGNPGGAADTHNNLGLLFRHQNKYAEALAHFNKAETVMHEITDRLGYALVLGNIADVLLAQQKTEEAEIYLKKALIESQEINAIQPLLRAIMWYGKLAEMRGDVSRAMQLWSFVNLHESCDGETRQDSETLLETVSKTSSAVTTITAIEASKALTLETIIADLQAPIIPK